MREAVMDYAACNVVYVDRAAREDKLVRREDVGSSPSSFNISEHAEGPGLIRRNTFTLDVNLKTLLATFSEGKLEASPFKVRPINLAISPCLYIWQIMCIETVRIEPSLHRRLNTNPRLNRYPIRRSITRATHKRYSNTFPKLEITD